jgi:ubiquinone/menaquinone biosynthesis C-methylase UbiE
VERVRAYYAGFGQREWDRLDNPADGVIERELTERALTRHLRGNERILDVGGGPGRYAIWLAQRGHRIVLTDLSPELLEIGKKQVAKAGVQLEAIAEADARDLSQWEDRSFGAVLCLGPFYHLQSTADREQVVREIARVLEPRGLVLAAFMPVLTFLRRTMAIPDERHRLLDANWVARLLDTGAFDNDRPGRFDHGYGARPEEIGPFFEGFGFEQLDLLSLEGVSPGIQPALEDISKEDHDLNAAVIHIIDRAARDPSIFGMANHLLYVGRLAQ